VESFLYFIFWAAIIFLMMRFGCGAHVMGHRHGHGGVGNQNDSRAGSRDTGELRWTPPTRDIDPVCGKSVATDGAKPSVFGGDVYYFCSRDCREVFEAAPDIYTSDDERRQPRQLEHSHE
jgi:YHS domain-containing protein